jgi:hypothetical protein
MNSKKIYSILLLLLFAIKVQSQESPYSVGFWHFRPVSGELSMLGSFRTLSSQLNDLNENLNSKHLQAGLKLNSASYMWNPDIISFNVSGEYNPEFRDDRYLVIPDRSEVRTLSRINLQSSVFNNKAISLNTFYNLNKSYFNRENLTNVRSDNRQLGTMLSVSNKILPLRLSYRDIKSDQTETESGRYFSMAQKSLEASTDKSFFGNDNHELRFSLRDYKYRYDELKNVDNQVAHIDFISQLFFDPDRKYGINSNVSFFEQKGTYIFSRFEVNERGILHLPHNLDLVAHYRFYKMNDPNQSIIINKARGEIKHKLFQSLVSQAYIDYTGTSHTYYNESSVITGGQINYTKKTRFGRINLGYHLFTHKNSVKGESNNINISREEHRLSDIDVTILDKPYIDQTGIIITDITSTIIYQEGLDYIINSINNFTEILRIPGGQIAQDQAVLVSYTAVQPGSYNYLAINNTLTSSILFFDRMLELYYRGSAQEYPYVQQTDYLTLNRFYQNITGLRVHYKIATAGVEYDYYNSDLIPYKRMNYYLNMNLKIKSRMLLSLNGTLRDHHILDQDLNYIYSNLSTRFSYSINRWSRINLEGSYLKQNGRTIDLDLITGRTEVITTFRKLTIKGSFSIYKRSYAQSNFLYTGTHLEIIRKF